MAGYFAALPPAPHRHWRDLYLNALFETDKAKSKSMIAEAERALLIRERELFMKPHDPAERDAVNNALHALHALKSCLGSDVTSLAA